MALVPFPPLRSKKVPHKYQPFQKVWDGLPVLTQRPNHTLEDCLLTPLKDCNLKADLKKVYPDHEY